jgi:large conductance mechanosensitive channel
MLKEFMNFLTKYGVVGLAIAVIIGGKLNELVGSLVNDVLMPAVFNPAMKLANVATIAELKTDGGILYGKLLGSLINFLIVAIVVFLFAKLVLREEKVEKK